MTRLLSTNATSPASHTRGVVRRFAVPQNVLQLLLYGKQET